MNGDLRKEAIFQDCFRFSALPQTHRKVADLLFSLLLCSLQVSSSHLAVNLLLLVNNSLFFFYGVFELGSCLVAQAGLELCHLLSQFPECCDYSLSH